MQNSLTFKCPAKVNLFLHITGKRQDGYHNIYTLFCPISLYDIITLEKSNKTTLTCSNKDIPVDSSNLILKTYNILQNNYGLKDNFKIHLEKNIPTGAGLGGGSSNAANYLSNVNKISNLNLTYNQMAEIMASIGSDTVFFLHNKPALASGRGEIIEEYIELPQLYLLIINPNIFISTKEIYSSPNLKYTSINSLDKIKKTYIFEELYSIMKNDMQNIVFNTCKEVKDIVDFLNNKTNGIALMSGSGSTVFAVYENENQRDFAYNLAKEQYKTYLIEKAAIVNQ